MQCEFALPAAHATPNRDAPLGVFDWCSEGGVFWVLPRSPFPALLAGEFRGWAGRGPPPTVTLPVFYDPSFTLPLRRFFFFGQWVFVGAGGGGGKGCFCEGLSSNRSPHITSRAHPVFTYKTPPFFPPPPSPHPRQPGPFPGAPWILLPQFLVFFWGVSAPDLGGSSPPYNKTKGTPTPKKGHPVPVANQIRTYWWCNPPRRGLREDPANGLDSARNRRILAQR